jgi:hypothetical protein
MLYFLAAYHMSLGTKKETKHEPRLTILLVRYRDDVETPGICRFRSTFFWILDERKHPKFLLSFVILVQ